MNKILLLALLMTPLSFASEEATVLLPCKVHKTAKRDTASECRLTVKAKVFLEGDTQGRYVQVTGGGCEGFVAKRCLSVGPALLIQPERKTRRPTTTQATESSSPSNRRLIRLGFNGSAGMLFGGVAYSTGNSTGLGFGGGAELKWDLSPVIALRFSPGLSIQGLSRTLTASGSITDPSAVEYSQSYTFLTLQATALYKLSKDLTPGKLFWSLAAGGEFLIPLSATQTSSLGSEVSFTADKHLFALLGPSVLYLFPDDWEIDVSVLGSYNVSGTSGSSALGVRLMAALTWGL